MYLRLWGVDVDELDLPLYFVQSMGMGLDKDLNKKGLQDMLLSGEYDALVIEPIRRVHDGNENDNTIMSRLHSTFRDWTLDKFITLILSHHTGHLSEDADLERIATWSRGCTDFASILDTAMFLQERYRRDDFRSLCVRQGGRHPPIEPFLMNDYSDPDHNGRGFARAG
jgi:hypothetical protein